MNCLIRISDKGIFALLLILFTASSVYGWGLNVGEDWTNSTKDFETTGDVTAADGIFSGEVDAGSHKYNQGDTNAVDTTIEAKLQAQVVSSSDYTSLALAISDIGATVTTLHICGTNSVADSTTITIPSTMTIDFSQCRGTIQGAAGGGTETLTINGGLIADPSQQCFGSNLTVTGNPIVEYMTPLMWQTNTTPGTTDMQVGWQAALTFAINAGVKLYVPPGDYYIGSKITATIADGTKSLHIRGERHSSIITSGVVGDTTLEINDAQGVYISGLSFVGNGLTGASGNGHAIALRDTTVGAGTYYPQNSIVELVDIKDFRGDALDEDGGSLVAVGIYIGAGLANKVKDVLVTNCGHGVVFYKSQQSSLYNSLILYSDKWNVRLIDCSDGMLISGNDILDGGYNLGSYSESIRSVTTPYGGVFVDGCDTNIIIQHNKFKNNISQIISLDSTLLSVDNSHIRPRDTNDNGEAGIWVKRTLKVNITKNYFLYIINGSRNYTGIYLDNLTNNGLYNYTITGNEFNHADTVDADILVDGNGASGNTTINISDNLFGNAGRSGTPAVTACIHITDGVYSGSVKNNTFIAGDTGSSATTITDTFKLGSGATLLAGSFDLFANYDKEISGGTITNATTTSRSSGVASDTTDGSGDIVITHGMVKTVTGVSAILQGPAAYILSMHTLTSTTFKIRVYDAAGAAVGTTAVVIRWTTTI